MEEITPITVSILTNPGGQHRPQSIKKNMQNSKNTEKGLTFSGALLLLFIALKLTGYIKWSWWLVLLPGYGALVVILIIFLILYLLFRFQ
jgi:Flp pilus assembly protein TadB